MTAHITFVHGVGNKPKAEVLLAAWTRALAAAGGIATGGASGVSVSMVYWADVLYEAPSDAIAARMAHAGLGQGVAASAEAMSVGPPDAALSEGEQIWIAKLEAKMKLSAAAHRPTDLSGPPAAPLPDDVPSPEADAQIERIPLPWFLKELFMKRFLRDVHHYLFNAQHSGYRVQDEIRRRFVEAVTNAPAVDHHIVVGHSLGSVIAYDCLKRVSGCPSVDGLLTVGSPLGIDEVQDKLRPEWTRTDGFPSAKVTRDNCWANVFDPYDLVAALDPYLAGDYKRAGTKKIVDTSVTNRGEWGHDIDIYLRTPLLRQRLQAML
jgi:predicted alpha/beta hydrolase family esterase